jgi:cytosine deaminase
MREAARTAERLAAAGISVAALPQGGCGVLDRGAVAPVRLLRTAGVRVTAGSGALGDLSNPVGRGDPLEAAFLLATHGECDAGRSYEMVSAQARAVLGLPEVRVEAGFPAELLAVRGRTVAGVLSLAYSRIVIHRGRVVARTSAVREFCEGGTGGGGDPGGSGGPGGPGGSGGGSAGTGTGAGTGAGSGEAAGEGAWGLPRQAYREA